MNDDYGQTNRAFTFEELLRFYQESGVDIGIFDQPINHFAHQPSSVVNRHNGEAATKAQPLQPALKDKNTHIQNSNRPKETTPQFKSNVPSYILLDDQVRLAREIAMRASNLDQLHENLLAFNGCPLKLTAKNTCFSDGNTDSRLMVISDVPEREEDLQGRPFVGQSGELLNKMLAAIGYNREDVYIANVLPWRPPGNREPTAHEVELCKPFIYRQIELANPRIIMTFGGLATTWLTNNNDSILRLRGNWMSFTTSNGAKIDLMPSLHPRYLLRNPAHKKFAWQDLLNVKIKLAELSN